MATIPTIADLQALIQQLQAQVLLALETAAATVAPTVLAATTAATSVVVFADTPQTLGVDDLINYSSKRGSDFYKQGIAPLDDKALTDGFNMTANQTVVFTEAFLNHATAMDWNMGSKQITIFTNSSGVAVDLIKSYGQIDEATMKTVCERFCKAGEADAESPVKQNNTMMSMCLNKSLTATAKASLLTYYRAGCTLLTASNTPPSCTDHHASGHYRQCCHHPNSAGQPAECRCVCSDG
jgi:hypothetical protein